LGPIESFILLFVISLVIRTVAVLGGIGGGMMFTSLMMGFTHINSYIIRATGLLIAMSGSVIAARSFLGRGLANIKLVLFAGVPYASFAVIGALMANYAEQNMGNLGEAAIRLCLGALVLIVALLLLFGGKRAQYPEVKNVDGLSHRLGLSMAYWEESLDKVVDYRVSRAPAAVLLFCGAGLLSGLFGVGAGWAMVPTLNLVMLAPLKVAAASSSVLMGVGDTAAVWSYTMGGAIFPPFAVPCLAGSMLGAIIGSRVMVKINAGFVRWLIIAIMIGSGIKLVLDGFARLSGL
jgi:uncharacterized membrane protein YfcA